jgi:hypothetical protein
VFWLVDAGKDDALDKLLADDPSIPAGRVEASDAVVITERGG